MRVNLTSDRRRTGWRFAAGPLLAVVVGVVVVGGSLLASDDERPRPWVVPVAETIPPEGLRDWDLALQSAEHQHGPYRLVRYPLQPVTADAGPWHAQFAGWTHEELGDDVQNTLRVLPNAVPPGYTPSGAYSVRSVSQQGSVAYQHWQVDFRLPETDAPPIVLYRMGYVAERWPDGIGVHGTPVDGVLQITLLTIDGVQVVVEHPSPRTDRYPFQRYRWVQNNVETVLEATAMRHADLIQIVREIILRDAGVE